MTKEQREKLIRDLGFMSDYDNFKNEYKEIRAKLISDIFNFKEDDTTLSVKPGDVIKSTLRQVGIYGGIFGEILAITKQCSHMKESELGDCITELLGLFEESLLHSIKSNKGKDV